MDSGAPSKRRKLEDGASAEGVPNANEMMQLNETSNLYRSNLFKLQIGAAALYVCLFLNWCVGMGSTGCIRMRTQNLHLQLQPSQLTMASENNHTRVQMSFSRRLVYDPPTPRFLSVISCVSSCLFVGMCLCCVCASERADYIR